MILSSKNKVIAIDIDGVLCKCPEFGKFKTFEEAYENAEPIKCAKEALDLLFIKGFRIILFSSRLEDDREVTMEWLKSHGFQFNELILGKPKYDVFIDDRVLKFKNWTETINELI